MSASFLSLDHRKHHLKAFYSINGVWNIGGHNDAVTGGQLKRMTVDNYLSFTFDNLNKGVEWGRMFTQALPGVEGEQGNVSNRFVKHTFADNSVFGIVYFSFEVKYFGCFE